LIEALDWIARRIANGLPHAALNGAFFDRCVQYAAVIGDIAKILVSDAATVGHRPDGCGRGGDGGGPLKSSPSKKRVESMRPFICSQGGAKAPLPVSRQLFLSMIMVTFRIVACLP
jgi:hypothetical protein